ncbi:MAG: NAD(P)-binding domain-containing protein [Actinomycetota bacterium]
MNVGVVGTGHVGLVTCASLAALGHDVVGTDVDGEKIAALEADRIPFHEPGLTELVAEQRAAGRLSFAAGSSEATASAEVIFICVGTPPGCRATRTSAPSRARREVWRGMHPRTRWSSRSRPCPPAPR